MRAFFLNCEFTCESVFIFLCLTLWFPFTHFFHPHLLPPAATNVLSVSMSLVFDFWFVALSSYSTYKIDRVVFVFLYLTYFA